LQETPSLFFGKEYINKEPVVQVVFHIFEEGEEFGEVMIHSYNNKEKSNFYRGREQRKKNLILFKQPLSLSHTHTHFCV